MTNKSESRADRVIDRILITANIAFTLFIYAAISHTAVSNYDWPDALAICVLFPLSALLFTSGMVYITDVAKHVVRKLRRK